MNNKLIKRVEKTHSLLCVGLDPENDIYDCYSVIEATNEYAACYKMNFAFFLSKGEQAIKNLNALVKIVPDDIPIILDAKFGDIGNTSEHYAKFVFSQMNFDGVTVNPYMGEDAIIPFANYKDKMIFSLTSTSNPSAKQLQHLSHPWNIHDNVAMTAARLACKLGDNVGFVVGDPSSSYSMRQQFPNAWFLCPGVGAQGGDLAVFVKNGLNKDRTGLLINVGRGITLASRDVDGYMNKVKAMRENAKEYYSAINSFR